MQTVAEGCLGIHSSLKFGEIPRSGAPQLFFQDDLEHNVARACSCGSRLSSGNSLCFNPADDAPETIFLGLRVLKVVSPELAIPPTLST